MYICAATIIENRRAIDEALFRGKHRAARALPLTLPLHLPTVPLFPIVISYRPSYYFETQPAITIENGFAVSARLKRHNSPVILILIAIHPTPSHRNEAKWRRLEDEMTAGRVLEEKGGKER